MSTMTSRQDRIQMARENFSVALQSALPLTHFSQFYDELEFDKLAQQQAKKCLAKIQEDSSEFDMLEIVAVTNELIQPFQEIIEQWKVKNQENKTRCKHFLESQVDFLLSDYRTSVVIQLVSAPDIGLKELTTFLEGRKNVMLSIFEKLSKPGEPQSSINIKTKLEERLECLKIETLEKQRVHSEQTKIEKGNKVLDDAKRKIMKKARQLKSDVIECLDNYSKDFVRGTLAEIDCYLRAKGKILNEYYPNIFSAILRTTTEVRKCLNEKEYGDMSAVEFAETLHEQLLFDFTGGNPCAMELDSFGPSDLNPRRASEFSTNEKELVTVHDESKNCNNESESEQRSLPNELPFNSAVEEEVKEENEDEVDHDNSDIDLMNSSDESASKNSGDDDGVILEVERGNEVEESTMTFDDKQISYVKSNKSSKHVSGKNINPHPGTRRSTRLQSSSQPVVKKCSRQKRQRSKSGGEHSEDPTTTKSNEDSNPSSPKRLQASSSKSKPNRRKLLHARTRHLTKDEVTPTADKITYLHLQRGIPYYRCNVCQRKCPQGLLRYHGEFCGITEDPFACKECRKACLSRGELEEHSRVHTGEKPFKCSKCPTRFARHRNLLKHMRSHEMAGRFICKPCKLVFVSTKELHIHKMAKHLGTLPFRCFYCDGRFKNLGQLKTHVIVHAEERPFQCPTCGIHYAMKEVLRRHLHSVHHRTRQSAIRLANQSALDYLRREMKDQSFGRSDTVPYSEINMLVASHIIKKAKLRIPEGTA